MNHDNLHEWLGRKQTTKNVELSFEDLKTAIQRSERIMSKSCLIQNEDVINVLKYSTEVGQVIVLMSQIIIDCNNYGIFNNEELKKYYPLVKQIVQQYANSQNDSQRS